MWGSIAGSRGLIKEARVELAPIDSGSKMAERTKLSLVVRIVVKDAMLFNACKAVRKV